MKKTLLIVICAIAIFNVAFGQTKPSKDEQLKAHIIDLENAGWNAFKTKNASWFQANLTEAYLQITDEGISNKKEVIQSLADCKLKSFSLDEYEMVKLNKSTVILIYIATQDGVCGGVKLPAKVRTSVNYVKQGGKWLEAFYMDTPIE